MQSFFSLGLLTFLYSHTAAMTLPERNGKDKGDTS